MTYNVSSGTLNPTIPSISSLSESCLLSAISVSVFTRILSSMTRRRILLACETRAIVLPCAHCLRSPFLGSGMNVENVHYCGHSPFSQIAAHILCILSSIFSPPALSSSAGTSLGQVDGSKLPAG